MRRFHVSVSAGTTVCPEDILQGFLFCKSREAVNDMTEKKYMELAIELAEKGCGRVAPNPMVGAVIVKDGRIIGRGYHRVYGELHAEREALRDCTEPPEGADMYVTLEPCCHHGKQPPCTDAIIEAGIKRVIIGSSDPNPLVSGKGVGILREHGVEVVEGVMKEDCDRLNRVFFHYITTGRPYVVMKYAMTADGKIATHTGASRWITGEEARRRVHMDRNRYTAIMAGIGTVLSDDPLLTCRLDGGRDPVRIICDTEMRIPVDSAIVQTADHVPTIIAVSREGSAGKLDKKKALTDAGCEIMEVSLKKGHMDLEELIALLGERRIDSVLLEGGATLNWAALEAGVVDMVQVYVAPKIFGGRAAVSPVGGEGVSLPSEAVRLARPQVTFYGDDILLESEVLGKCSQE